MRITIVILMIATSLSFSCGSRKVETEISKHSEKINEGGKEKGEEKSNTQSKSQSKEENKADKTEDIVTTTTVDELNEKGDVTKRTQTTKTEKRIDRSVNNKSASEELKSFQYKTFTKTYWKTITIRKFYKEKASKTSNTSFYVVICVLGGLLLLFAWLYLKVRNKAFIV